MLTYRLILPSVICLKVSGFLNILPLKVNAASGTYECRKSSCISQLIRCIIFTLSLLRGLQLSYTIHDLISRSYVTGCVLDEDKASIVNASIGICMGLVCLTWNVELWRKKDELVSLLRSADIKPAPGKVFLGVRRKPRLEKRAVMDFYELVIRLVVELHRYIRLAWRDMQILRPTITSKEICTILTPFAVISLIPFAFACLYLRTPYHLLAVSALSEEQLERHPVIAMVLSLVDATLCVYGALAFHAGFYVGFLLEGWCISRLKTLLEQAE